ncbi:hypothetical protein H671_1g0277 [Cricetulus griseus]|nr:hypothetical protein H671_1g0277 [Cricetulus griseus]
MEEGGLLSACLPSLSLTSPFLHWHWSLTLWDYYVYTEEQLRHAVSWTEQLLHFQTFYQILISMTDIIFQYIIYMNLDTF